MYNGIVIFFILGIIFFCPARRNAKIILNNFGYKVHMKRADRTYWRCSHERSNCKARIITQGNCIKMNLEVHNHAPTDLDCSGYGSQIVRIIYMKERSRKFE